MKTANNRVHGNLRSNPKAEEAKPNQATAPAKQTAKKDAPKVEVQKHSGAVTKEMLLKAIEKPGACLWAYKAENPRYLYASASDASSAPSTHQWDFSAVSNLVVEISGGKFTAQYRYFAVIGTPAAKNAIAPVVKGQPSVKGKANATVANKRAAGTVMTGDAVEARRLEAEKKSATEKREPVHA